MDKRMFDEMLDNYSSMSDDELIYIHLTRQDSLTDEAKLALDESIRKRNIPNLEQEIAASRRDLDEQAESLLIAQKRQAKVRNNKKWAMRLVYFTGLLFGIALCIFSDGNDGPLIIVFSVLGLIYVELKRLLFQFISTLLRNADSKKL